MQDAATGRHPLDIAGADRSTLAGGVAVGDFSIVNNRDGFEAPVGMLADSARFGRRLKFMRPRKVEQQEGAYFGALRSVEKKCPNGKAIAHPMLIGICPNTEHRFHRGEPFDLG